MINIYLDIDGVIRGCASPKEDIEEFLWYCLDNYPDSIYWLTTHCNHDVNRAQEAIQDEFSKELVDELSQKVKLTEWEVLKTDGINNIVPMSGVVEESVPEVPPLCLLFGEKPPKPKGKPPTYVKIMDWKKNKTIKFIDVVKKG